MSPKMPNPNKPTTNLTRASSCSVGECDRQARSVRMCNAHYQKQYTSPERHSYNSMRGRCQNPNRKDYQSYGACGIAIAERWLGEGGFERFLIDMGHRPKGTTLDRIDGSLGYSPENCRWSTYFEQQVNTGISSRNTSGVKGLYFNKENGNWNVYINVMYTRINLGTFANKDDATAVRRVAEEIFFGRCLDALKTKQEVAN